MSELRVAHTLLRRCFFSFDNATCFSRVNLNLVSQFVFKCVNIIACEKLFTATERHFSYTRSRLVVMKMMKSEKEIPTHIKKKESEQKMNREAILETFTLK